MALTGTFLVTGGAGFIGSNIAGMLAERGARVRVVDDLSTGHEENIEEIGGRVDFIRASVTDRGAMRRALDGVEVVFHEAAIPSVPRSVDNPLETHRACVDGTFSLLWPRVSGVRRSSTRFEYGLRRQRRPEGEDMAPPADKHPPPRSSGSILRQYGRALRA